MIAAIRRWAARHTERGRYSPVGIAFHWIMAALILFQLGWGWYASNHPPGGDKIAAFRIHADIGLLILVLAMLRFVWRMIVPGPRNDADIPGPERAASVATHVTFYVAFFALPLSGWMMWSSMGEMPPLRLAGVLPWPYLPVTDLPTALQYWLLDWGETIHQLFVVVLALLVPLHVAAALKHHYWDRHDVLEGMLPLIPDEEGPAAARRHEPRPGLSPTETSAG